MTATISPSDVYDKNLNFLFGSGASFGLFPTLSLGIQTDEGKSWSLEDLATHFENTGDERLTPLFMHYYRACIDPAQKFTIASAEGDSVRESVVKNYSTFIKNILQILQHRKPMEKRCNLFTTNYDGCFPLVADKILQQGDTDFVLNDGARGFSRRYLQARNFNTFVCQTGIFERHQTSIPQINLVHVHGSVYWRKDGDNIVVEYDDDSLGGLLSVDVLGRLQAFSTALEDKGATLASLPFPAFTQVERDAFWMAYKKLPIVNPTKWKFHETVFEEHYYQMLRMLSYELEKPNAVLITFGFSFADEHILNLVKRSLSNPHLQVFICCYSAGSSERLSETFRGYNNVRCVVIEDGVMDFTAFNERVFFVSPPAPLTAPTPISISMPATAPISAAPQGGVA
ncbi:SIR2 family protein [Variovorax sp. UC122_21]|uniref:SIR2 family protein n=1 Tax=Variovorax sp. UC122_21 TaxID=3374554 RepID=UPI003756366B